MPGSPLSLSGPVPAGNRRPRRDLPPRPGRLTTAPEQYPDDSLVRPSRRTPTRSVTSRSSSRNAALVAMPMAATVPTVVLLVVAVVTVLATKAVEVSSARAAGALPPVVVELMVM